MCGGSHAPGGMHWGACVAGGMHGGHVWLVCMVGGKCGRGDMHGMGCAWQGGMCGGSCMQERWPLKRAVHILLECILVLN